MADLMIQNWDRYQHYKADRPAWVKWYREVTNDLTWLALPDEGKLLWPYILLVAAETSNRIPSDPKLLSLRLRLRLSIVRKGLDSLTNSGFLHIVQDDADNADVYMPNAHARTRSVSVSYRGNKRKNEEDKDFAEFWRHYPKRIGKIDARKAWKQMAKDRPPLCELIAKVDELALSRDWLKDNGQWIPYPATWLRAGGWDDEVRGKR